VLQQLDTINTGYNHTYYYLMKKLIKLENTQESSNLR